MSGDRPGPALLDQRFGELTAGLAAASPRDRAIDSAGTAALAEEVARLRAQIAERTAERDTAVAELDRLTAIVAEYATRETEPPAEPEPEPPAKLTALAVAIYAESHEVKGWDDCEAITHADHVEAIVRVRGGYASAKLVLERLFYDVDAITAEQLEELAYNTLTSLVRAAREASPW